MSPAVVPKALGTRADFAASAWRFLLWGALSFLVAVAPGWIRPGIGNARGQEAGTPEWLGGTVPPSPSRMPYRRVFVPDTSLDQWLPDGYRPLDIGLWKRWADSIDPASIPDSNAPNIQPELKSFHSFARLAGADLVAEKARLLWWRDSIDPQQSPQSTPRRSLSPWSMSLEIPTGKALESITGGGSDAPKWLMDPSGVPLVRPTSDEEWFSWSLHPLPRSTPNRLNYAWAIPAAADSCLVLALPQGARIVDSNVVVQCTSDWGKVSQRFSDWPRLSASLEGIADWLRTDEVFWILELTGQEKIRFSIALGTPQGNPSSPGASGLDSDRSIAPSRLIAKQTIQHSIRGGQVRTASEWEWYEPTRGMDAVRLELPEGTRLRSLSINDREAVPQWIGRSIEIPLTAEAPATSGAPWLKMRMAAEFFTDLSNRDTTKPGSAKAGAPNAVDSPPPAPFQLPEIGILGSYVVSGSTSLTASAEEVLCDVTASSGRLAQSRRPPGEGMRLEYAWFQRSPTLRFRLAPNLARGRAELLTSLSTDAEFATAIVRMQLEDWQGRLPQRVGIADGWELDSFQIPSKSATLTRSETEGNVPRRWVLESTGLAESGPLALELRLKRRIPDDPQVDVADGALVELPGWIRSDVLVMEPNYALRLEFADRFPEEIVREEMLTPWQRDRLPRLGRYLLLQMPDGRLSGLRWKAQAMQLEVAVQTRVSVQEYPWRVRHSIEIPSQALRSSELRIHLPGQWRWQVDDGESIQNVELLPGVDRSEWRIPRPLLDKVASRETPSSLRLIASHSLPPPQDLFAVPFPSFPDATRLAYALRMAPSLRLQSTEGRTDWVMTEDGDREMRWPSQPGSQPPPKAWIELAGKAISQSSVIPRADMHFAIDSLGHQRGYLTAVQERFPQTSGALSLELPDRWRVVGAMLRGEGPSTRVAIHHETRGQKTVVHLRPWSARSSSDQEGEPQENSPRVFALELAGPSLEPITHWRYGLWAEKVFPVDIPRIVLLDRALEVRTTLWTPPGLSLGRLDAVQEAWWTLDPRPVAPQESWWSLWSWTRETMAGFWPTSESRATLSGVQADAPWLAPAELLPPLLSKTWNPTDLSPASALEPNVRFAIQPTRSPILPCTLFAVWLLATPKMLQRMPWTTLIVSAALVGAGHWMPTEIGTLFRASVVGMGLGTSAYLAYLATTSVQSRPTRGTPRADGWLPWNEPSLTHDSPIESSRPRGGLSAVTLLICLGLGTLLPSGRFSAHNRLEAQEPAIADRSLPTPRDVLIPVSPEGDLSGSKVYVPGEWVRALESSETVLPQDRDAYLVSAKHAIRFDSRSLSFGNPEQQCTHTYEVWIGDLAVGRPWRIPFPSDRSRLSRFTVDGTEVASSRFTKSDVELIWYPERSGRRVLQIESQLRIRPADEGRAARTNATAFLSDARASNRWSLDAAILPSANALLEIDTDGAWTAEMEILGRVSNPSIGKYVLRLGNVDRIRGELKAMQGAGGRAMATVGSDGGTASSESPQIHTELFLDRDQLLARTVIEYPRGIEPPEEVEIESDQQWQPMGAVWGDASLVEVKPGSTLDRRRYVVRWNETDPALRSEPNNPTSSEAVASVASQGRLSIATTWVPVGEASLRNVLFAECRDRRVRPGTLRFARAPGSSWTLEGVSAWTPSIQPNRDRLDWMELSEKPMTTSLKIPLSGGFGVLRWMPEPALPRVRVGNTLSIEANRAVLKSRLEFSSPANSRSLLLLNLPPNYLVTRVSVRATPIPYTQWQDREENRLQIFLDRDAGEVNELILSGERRLDASSNAVLEVPTLVLRSLPLLEQTTEWTAESSWRVATGPDPQTHSRGQGPAKILGSIPESSEGTRSSLEATRLVDPWSGSLHASELRRDEEGLHWELIYAGTPSANVRPRFALSLPSELARNWSSTQSVREFVDLDPGRKLFIVEPSWSEGSDTPELRIEWVADGDQDLGGETISKVVLAGDPGLVISAPQVHREAFRSEIREREALGAESIRPGKAWAIHRDLGCDAQAPNRRLWHHEVWIQPPSTSASNASGALHAAGSSSAHGYSETSWVWELPVGTRCDWILINGSSVPFTVEENALRVFWVDAGLPMQVEMWTTTEVATTEGATSAGALGQPVGGAAWDDLAREAFPKLRGEPGSGVDYVLSGEDAWLLPSGSKIDRRLLDRKRIETLLTSIEQLVATTGDSPARSKNLAQGMRSRWLDRWVVQCRRDLERWSQMRASTDVSYAESAARWGRLLELEPRWKTLADLPGDLYLPPVPSRIDDAVDFAAATETATGTETAWASSLDRWIATLSLVLAIVLAAAFWQRARNWLKHHPWWLLGGVGGWLWLLTGWLWPAVVLMAVGAALSFDTYWILTERFRQTGIRGRR